MTCFCDIPLAKVGGHMSHYGRQMQKRSFIMTRTLIIESGQKPTEEQLKEVEEAKKSPINFDEDCEELSPAMMKAFKSAIVQRNRRKKA